MIIPSLKPNDCLEYLQQFITHNKARGMIAESSLIKDMVLSQDPAKHKLLFGGWLLSPKIIASSYFRYLIFVSPILYNSDEELQIGITALQNNRDWQTLATFLSQAGIGCIVSAA